MNEVEPQTAVAERNEEPTPARIYVASLSDYNAGRLHGVWLDAHQAVDELHEGVQAMLDTSPEPGAEEWAIHDFQGFGAAELSEYESLETVARLARGIAEHGGAFAAWAALSGLDRLVALDAEAFEEAYRGHWPSATAYAEELLDETGATEALEAVPEWLQPYVSLNVAGFARDLELGGDIRTVEGDGGVWVFDAER